MGTSHQHSNSEDERKPFDPVKTLEEDLAELLEPDPMAEQRKTDYRLLQRKVEPSLEPGSTDQTDTANLALNTEEAHLVWEALQRAIDSFHTNTELATLLARIEAAHDIMRDKTVDRKKRLGEAAKILGIAKGQPGRKKIYPDKRIAKDWKALTTGQGKILGYPSVTTSVDKETAVRQICHKFNFPSLDACSKHLQRLEVEDPPSNWTIT